MGRDKNEEILVLKHDLKAIIFWAAYGIKKARSGSYRDAAGRYGIVDSYAKLVDMADARSPEFAEYL